MTFKYLSSLGKALISTLIVLLGACHRPPVIEQFAFILELGDYTIDAQNQLYRVRYADRNDSTVTLHFTSQELASIRDIYLANNLYELPAIYEPKEQCNETPLIPVTLTILYNQDKKQIFKLTGCDDYGFMETHTANKVEQIIGKIRTITFAKSTVKKVPKSNVLWL
ncbi:hypothetical protein ACFQ4C_30515 [Larkinella insperata]|uniref:Lipoprotein n=1 Tax=Larkinella insperata TaxID=332158 RepID=A0ABW3QMV2_9BACT